MSNNNKRLLYIFIGCIIGIFLGQEALHNDHMMILFALGLALVIILVKIKKLK